MPGVLSLPRIFAIPAGIADFFALTKPRVSFVVTLTALAGMAAAPSSPHPVLAAASLLAVFGASGASGAFNMWAERESDKYMRRTKTRPLPAGRMAPEAALHFSVVLGALSLMLMVVSGGLQATALLAGSIFIYCYIYTVVLKRSSEQNIVIGGLSGALPPMIGWAAAGGDAFSPLPLLMTLTIFLWTPAHFWALAVARAGEYDAAGIPMLPCKRTRAASGRLILLYTALTVAAGAACGYYMAQPLFYTLAHGALALWWLYACIQFLREQTDKRAMAAFGISVAYTAYLCVAWISFS